jgi:hypothetical protein
MGKKYGRKEIRDEEKGKRGVRDVDRNLPIIIFLERTNLRMW